MTIETLNKFQLREIKAGRAKMLVCANCGKETYYGQMNILSLGICNNKPVCSYECNKALGQVS